MSEFEKSSGNLLQRDDMPRNEVGNRLRSLASTLIKVIYLGILVVLVVFLLRYRSSRVITTNQLREERAVRDKLVEVKQEIEEFSRRSTQIEAIVKSTLGYAKTAKDIPNLGGNRIAAFGNYENGFSLYVPKGDHTLLVVCDVGPTNQPEKWEGAKIQLLPESAYRFDVEVADKPKPLSWSLTSNNVNFQGKRNELVVENNFAKSGGSWSSNQRFSVPNFVNFSKPNSIKLLESDPEKVTVGQLPVFDVTYKNSNGTPNGVVIKVFLVSKNQPVVGWGHVRYFGDAILKLVEPDSGDGWFRLKPTENSNSEM